MGTRMPDPHHDGVDWLVTMNTGQILRLLLRLLSFSTTYEAVKRPVLTSQKDNYLSTGPGISKNGDSARCRHRQHMRSQRDSFYQRF